MEPTRIPRPATWSDPRNYTPAETWVDAVVHVMGVALSVSGAAILLHAVASEDNAAKTIAASVYSVSLVITLSCSAAYNLLRHPLWKERARPCDHAAIFLLIAGTYTPFLLVSLAGVTGYALLAVVWVLALTGMALKLLHPRRYDRLFVLFYLALGWIGLPTAGMLAAALSTPALALLVTGGLLYTAGVAFHLWERLPYQNAIWHTFVLLAAVCHFLAVFQILSGES